VEEFMALAPQRPEWIAEARNRLIRLFSEGCGWGYKPKGMTCTEPTALAWLALKATQTAGEKYTPAANAAARWLASVQQPSGAVGISKTLSSPEWPTPYAMLVWSGQEEYAEQAARATDWLLKWRGLALKNQPKVSPQDSGIVGWPWVTHTFSWIEPTAMAVLALRRRGLSHHPRVVEALRLIMDRSISTGGWNYGNNIIYGTTLRPQPTDTGMALTAVCGVRDADSMAASACAYLESIIPHLRAPQSLCWALLGLTAWQRRPPDAEKWIKEAYEHVIRQAERAPQLSYLLLASSEQTLDLLGIQREMEAIP
jgi:hypothetical protein